MRKRLNDFKPIIMTYTQAYSKIIDAYFKDEIKPYCGQFCFCGTLCGFIDVMDYISKEPNYHGWPTYNYSADELDKMEKALLTTIFISVNGDGSFTDPFFKDNSTSRKKTITHPLYEDALFAGMSAALEVLKSIHIGRGEQVDEIVFEKRKKEMA